MKKIAKRIAAMGAAVMMMASMSVMGASANTTAEASGKAGTYGAGAQNRITQYDGMAITTLSTNSGVTIAEADYKTQINGGYQVYNQHRIRYGTSGISVCLAAQQNTKTFNLYSYHTASYKGYKWYKELLTVWTK